MLGDINMTEALTVIAAFVGGVLFGVFVMCLAGIAKQSDKRIDKMMQDGGHF